jgi:hypothetical protein
MMAPLGEDCRNPYGDLESLVGSDDLKGGPFHLLGGRLKGCLM